MVQDLVSRHGYAAHAAGHVVSHLFHHYLKRPAEKTLWVYVIPRVAVRPREMRANGGLFGDDVRAERTVEDLVVFPTVKVVIVEGRKSPLFGVALGFTDVAGELAVFEYQVETLLLAVLK